jgi:hypothetical protein
MTTLNDLRDESFRIADEHGWHDEPRTFGEIVALLHSEVSESLEDFRHGHAPTEVWLEKSGKPCGIPIELVDVIIRIFDAAGVYGIDLDDAYRVKTAYNRTRPYRHGGRRL